MGARQRQFPLQAIHQHDPQSLRELLERFQQRRSRLTVPQFTVITGLLVIAVGTVLMAQPVFSGDSVGLWQGFRWWMWARISPAPGRCCCPC